MCDRNAHVDCFFAIQCFDGEVRRSAHAPYPCCTQAQCSQALQSGVCWVARHTCESGACGSQRRLCNTGVLLNAWRQVDLSLFCAGGGRRPGDPCRADGDCVPQVEGSVGRLRCDRDAGHCAVGPRPAVAAGAPCVWDDDCADDQRCDCGSNGVRRCVRGGGAALLDAGVE